MKKRIPIKDLWCDCVDMKPVDIDWREAIGENFDGFTPYEYAECSCGHGFVAVGFSPECPKCNETMESAEGPMMNYYYPVEIKDCMEAAEKIKDLPLCVIDFGDGSTALALTGGGMDLSWDIVRAFVRLGYLPPVHFTLPDMLGWENYSDAAYIIRACQTSAKVSMNRAKRRVSDYRDMRKRLTSFSRAKKENKNA